MTDSVDVPQPELIRTVSALDPSSRIARVPFVQVVLVVKSILVCELLIVAAVVWPTVTCVPVLAQAPVPAPRLVELPPQVADVSGWLAAAPTTLIRYVFSEIWSALFSVMYMIVLESVPVAFAEYVIIGV